MRQGHRRGLLHLPAVPAHDRAPRRHPVESDGARRNEHGDHQIDARAAPPAAARRRRRGATLTGTESDYVPLDATQRRRA
ncbi:hypothetical protein BVI1335_2360017 [Burkholderia vietnamiensis]|nr:hypothetical protein BVI1335_2360017 [Burkholderia vietnamiensis]